MIDAMGYVVRMLPDEMQAEVESVAREIMAKVPAALGVGHVAVSNVRTAAVLVWCAREAWALREERKAAMRR